MGHWFQQNIVEPGKLPLLLALSAFVLTFAITRVITRMIRAGKGPFRNFTPGGVHVHHVVPGVVLSVVGGFGAVASGQQGVAAGVFAVVFAVGAGLVLDEFALILHLDDVYWTEEGRQSVEMVVLTASLVLLVLAGFSPLGVNELSDDQQQNRLGVVLTYVVNFGFVLIALFKGKARMAVIGTLIPVIALIAALRLARPTSPWAKRFYRRRHRARARAVLRAYHHDVRWAGPRRRFQDLIGGAPDRTPLPGPRPGGGT
ncbi:hypothetical protein B046DRAFT_05201 [Streptomyces sp. LamerLS-316]|uniref:hypothetical protein n=1 Tax=unclassified Streptomyces TaxID=2593676 RepID=UPI0008237837|nr:MULTISPECIES: hypothetical protein [unclassified Streptomyces]MYQ38195.1 hypothetical protein [Streptomyces sp. SID4921]SCK49389.1 hypothetical protein B046DRAFT_05201 [Streptomyces sp. LamerLS-316]